MNPKGIIIVKADIFSPVLRAVNTIKAIYPDKGYPERVLNSTPIPFPGSGQQAKYREQIGEILRGRKIYPC